MKKGLSSILAVVAIVAMMTSCGKSGSNFDIDVADDGIFGKLPVITAEYKDQGVEFMKELLNTKDREKQKEALQKTQELENKANEVFMAAFEDIKDIEIPTEVGDSMPIKINTPFKINKEEGAEFSEIPIIAEAEMTIDQPDRFAQDFFWFTYPKVVLVDAGGKPLLYLKGTNKMLKDQNCQNAGAKFNIEVIVHMKLWNAKLLGQAKKIVLYNEKSETFQSIRKENNEAEKGYDKKMNQLLSGDKSEEE
jgi:hypothetical protein